MKLLLSNDDGVYSVGIQTMARSLTCAGHEVLVVAPDRERSAHGHAMTLDRPLHLKEVERKWLSTDFPAYACDGTPTDCVIMGFDVLKFDPDMVISGINQGPNLGDDLTYSGTACAAMEGLIFGVPSIAVSLVSSSRDAEHHNETAADVTIALIEWTKENPLRDGVMFNVNVPNVPLSELKGISLTKKGNRRYRDKIRVVKSPEGCDTYWIGGKIEDLAEEGTDVMAIGRNFASVTPIHMDMTCFEACHEYKKAGIETALEKKLFSIHI